MTLYCKCDLDSIPRRLPNRIAPFRLYWQVTLAFPMKSVLCGDLSFTTDMVQSRYKTHSDNNKLWLPPAIQQKSDDMNLDVIHLRRWSWKLGWPISIILTNAVVAVSLDHFCPSHGFDSTNSFSSFIDIV